MFPTPPRTSGVCISFQVQTSLKYWYYCITIADDTPRWSIVFRQPRSKWEQASCELVNGCCQRKCRSSVTPWYDIPGTTTYEACNRRFLLDETVVSATWLAPHLSSQQETVVMHPLCHSLVSSSNYISSEVEDVHLKKSNGLGHVLAVQRSEADDTNVACASV